MELYHRTRAVMAIIAFSVHALAALSGNDTDRLSLMEFKRRISDDPFGWLKSWNDSQHHCEWQGVTCGKRHQRVTALSLRGKSLAGTISPHIGNLSFMKMIDVSDNRFHGEIPGDVGRFSRLAVFNLSRNEITGEIPGNLSHCLELRVISLFRNQLVGKIPPQLAYFNKLQILYLYTNNLTGQIPRSFGNLSSLEILSVTYNHLEGSLPREIGLLSKLYALFAGVNQLSGVIPPEIYNITAMTAISVTSNMFRGTIPLDLDLKLPNLQELEIYGNQFTGEIPAAVTNMSKLRILEVGANSIQGKIPIGVGNLKSLEILNVEVNLLGSNSSGDLEFLVSLTNCTNLQELAFDENNLGGKLPNVIGNLSSQLTQVYMNLNQISGPIPSGFGKLVNLFIVNLEQNLFTGEIPSDLVELVNLQYLSLMGNLLSGRIPLNFCNITSLYALDLSNNSFQGDISQSLQNCKYLQQLDISENNITGFLTPQTFAMLSSPSLVNVSFSQNSLSGPLPMELGKLTNLNAFVVSYNKFSGQIPWGLADCSGLELLYMQGNFFHGNIPQDFALLKAIKEIDLSDNNLTGKIPSGLQNLTSLNYLNLSFNDLEGEVPTAGVFANITQIFLAGNAKLCGGIPQLRLPTCVIPRKKKSHSVIIVVATTIAAILMISIAFILCCIMYRKKNSEQESPIAMPNIPMALRVSYHDLHQATEGFSPTNLIGSGSFGCVYKGTLKHHADRLVAVKVLDIQKNGASKSFKAECTALCNLRHRNLLPLITYCSSIDSEGDEFKALVYEFMEKGSLDTWLHPDQSTSSTRYLNLLQRLNVAVDVASALDYLHNHSESAVAHCDVKPSNVLLDRELTAHLGDFGLARLLPNNRYNSHTQQAAASSSTIAIKDPLVMQLQYAMGLEVSTEGDVFSFGILLLEMFTGRRPTDSAFRDGLDLHDYVKNLLPVQVMQILDPKLLLKEADAEVECLVSVLKIGLGCSQTSAKHRSDMKQVTQDLHRIRDAIFGQRRISPS